MIVLSIRRTGVFFTGGSKTVFVKFWVWRLMKENLFSCSHTLHDSHCIYSHKLLITDHIAVLEGLLVSSWVVLSSSWCWPSSAVVVSPAVSAPRREEPTEEWCMDKLLELWSCSKHILVNHTVKVSYDWSICVIVNSDWSKLQKWSLDWSIV